MLSWGGRGGALAGTILYCTVLYFDSVFRLVDSTIIQQIWTRSEFSQLDYTVDHGMGKSLSRIAGTALLGVWRFGSGLGDCG